jgi:hypothetical protein
MIRERLLIALSNLRQLSLAAFTYTVNNKGVCLP